MKAAKLKQDKVTENEGKKIRVNMVSTAVTKKNPDGLTIARAYRPPPPGVATPGSRQKMNYLTNLTYTYNSAASQREESF